MSFLKILALFGGFAAFFGGWELAKESWTDLGAWLGIMIALSGIGTIVFILHGSGR